METEKADHNNGATTIYLSTHGQNTDEVPKELVSFLQFVKANLHESTKDFEDAFVKKLQDYIIHVKESREMGERFMIWQEMLREERNEGQIQGRIHSILDLLKDLGHISENLEQRILEEKNEEVLCRWLKLAAKSENLEQFIKNM